MENKKEEIKLLIESKVESIAGLVNDYEELGGKVIHLTMLQYNDDGDINSSSQVTSNQ